VPDHVGMKLGKQAAKIDSRTLKLSRYFLATLPAAPPKVTYSKGVTNWGMMLNDQYGDCTIAGAAHAVQVWTLNCGGKMVTLSDSMVLGYYSTWDGFDPKNEFATDRGGVEIDVLNLWRHDKFNGHELVAYADPDVQNLEHVRQAHNLFGGLYIGLNLPLTAQTQEVWDTPIFKTKKSAPGSWGGHCVFVCDYDQESFTCITWGKLKKMTKSFWLNYCDEAHALLSPDWLSQGKSIHGFDLATLTTDLRAVTG